MTQNTFLKTARYIVIELLGELAYFPIWWYSRGVKKTAVFFWQAIINMERRLGWSVWLTNLFNPMYGQRDWQSVLISFFVRLFQIVFRGILLLIWLVLMFLLALFWLALPLLVIYQLVSFFNK
ncbi:MAG TPA: hypothetical protein PKL09_04165 [bacterium]|nr:hypothetical protein [bacterium]HNP75519.1 hypothetical protein [bacterium]HNS33601.1 hypothetical protein [bacterium]HNZ73744.1 hypothetical protein [bacterium]HOH67055.1 hypothetical protein [bacterium]